jgi:Flagellar regulatory protein FleQ
LASSPVVRKGATPAHAADAPVADDGGLRQDTAMKTSLLFMIVDETPDRAENLKELIEFMDVPEVKVAIPEDWRSRIGDSRLAAVFLSDDLDNDKLRRLIADVGDHDPNVPIVLVKHAETHA